MTRAGAATLRHAGWRGRLLAAAALAGLAAGWAVPAAAADPAEWHVTPERSAILFDFELNGEPRRGSFARFEGEGRIDVGDPASAAFELRIVAGSIDLGNRLFSAFATSAEWFDASNHPKMRFRLHRLEPLGRGRYEAVGDLTIRGRTLPAAGSLRLDFADGTARAEGRLDIDRTAYLLGVGPSALVVDVSPSVTVRFDLRARPAAQESHEEGLRRWR